MKNKNVHIMPQVKHIYDAQLQQLKEHMRLNEYEKALSLLDELHQFPYSTPELHFHSLTCYVKLKRLYEAELYCETLLLHKESELYYDYLSFYLLILLEQKKYYDVIIIYEREKKQLPNVFQEKIALIYEEARHMLQEESHQLEKDLKNAILSNDFERQFQLIHRWKKQTIQPSEYILQLLIDSNVHPILKTVILEVLKQTEIRKIEVEKFGNVRTFDLDELPNRFNHPFFTESLTMISNVSQDNPALFQTMEQLLKQFVTVWYPFYFTSSDIPFFTDALLTVAKDLLQIPIKHETSMSKTNFFIESIKLCHELSLEG